MTKDRQYDYIMNGCIILAIVSAVLFDLVGYPRLLFGSMGIFAALVAGSVYFRNLWQQIESTTAAGDHSDVTVVNTAQFPELEVTMGADAIADFYKNISKVDSEHWLRLRAHHQMAIRDHMAIRAHYHMAKGGPFEAEFFRFLRNLTVMELTYQLELQENGDIIVRSIPRHYHKKLSGPQRIAKSLTFSQMPA